MKLLQALNFRRREHQTEIYTSSRSKGILIKYAKLMHHPSAALFGGVAVGQVSGILCSFAAATPLLQWQNGIVFYVFAYARMHMKEVWVQMAIVGGGGKVARWLGWDVRKWVTYFGDNHPTKMAHIFRLLPCASFRRSMVNDFAAMSSSSSGFQLITWVR